jgi:hypothetical protein
VAAAEIGIVAVVAIEAIEAIGVSGDAINILNTSFDAKARGLSSRFFYCRSTI